MFKFFGTPTFTKDLEKLESSVQRQVKEKLAMLRDLDNPLFFSTKLKGKKNLFRFRAGDYRVFFRLEKNRIILLTVDHRKNIYKGL